MTSRSLLLAIVLSTRHGMRPETFVAMVVTTGRAVVLDLVWKQARPD